MASKRWANQVIRISAGLQNLMYGYRHGAEPRMLFWAPLGNGLWEWAVLTYTKTLVDQDTVYEANYAGQGGVDRFNVIKSVRVFQQFQRLP